MIRLKATVFFAGLVILIAVLSWKLIEREESEFRQEELEPSLEAQAATYDQVLALRINELEGFARSVLDTDLPLYMDILQGIRKEFSTVARESRSRVQGDKPRRAFVRTQGKVMLERIRARIEGEARAQVDLEGQPLEEAIVDMLVTAAISDFEPFDFGYFQVMGFALRELIFPDLKGQFAGDRVPDLFVVVDGTENVSRVLYDNFGFAIGYVPTSTEEIERELLAFNGHKTSMREFAPVVQAVMAEDAPEGKMFSGVMVRNDRVFLVVASPVTGRETGLMGSLVVGYELEQNRARRDAGDVLGVRAGLKRCYGEMKEDEEEPSDALCQRELQRQTRGLSYVGVDSSNPGGVFSGSSLPREESALISRLFRSSGAESEGAVRPDGSTNYLWKARHVPVDVVDRTIQAHYVVSMRLDEALAPFSMARRVLVVALALSILAGILMIQFLVRSLKRPFEEIDKGINEVIGGNFEYQFPFKFSEQLASSMAQSLMVMKAILQGQPTPEEEEEGSSWGEDLRVEGEEIVGELQQQDDSDSGPVIEEVDASAVKEAKTDYYRRIYKEFVDARRSIGQEATEVKYSDFIKKIVRNEQIIRRKYGCKGVLFRVAVKENQVVLVPVKVTGCTE